MESANFERLRTVVDDIFRQGTQVTEAESLLRTLKLVSRIRLSFLEGD
jgi:predicted amidophosphoribosyltransferase